MGYDHGGHYMKYYTAVTHHLILIAPLNWLIDILFPTNTNTY